jgi:hypothetical protein
MGKGTCPGTGTWYSVRGTAIAQVNYGWRV